jgi:CheY-like chemotaxis protein
MAVSTALVIDDSKSARIMLSRLVQKNGIEVNMVESGEEALVFLVSNPLPDVIFMDHMMPGMDGLQTTREITKNPLTSHIPILMYTSKEGDAYEAEVKNSGAYAMLGKPAKPERLKELIDELNTLEPITAAEINEVIVERTNIEIAKPEQNEPVIISTEEEEEEMSKELIEEVSTKLISRALEDALYPISSSLHKLETSTHENKSDIRKLTARQDHNVNLVSQAVLDASLKQTTTQLQTQITSEIKSIRDLLEQKTELSPKALEQITQIAIQSGGESGARKAEKAAMSAAEAVAAKVSAAQAQIQVKQDIAPYIAQAKKANVMAIIAIITAVAAIITNFIP